MDEKYFPKKVEAKWQKKWAESRAFEVSPDTNKPKFYQLEMLPYPSGNLHMGHVRNYSVGDAVAWYKRLKGFNVLHPIGWDSFGQPAEDAAIKRGVNPRTWTEENITAMQGQMQRLGISYDWSRQMAAHRPEFYKFDQWFFLKMYEMGLAYKRMTKVNWCEHDQATLSNEQASGGLCWRCGNPVTKRDLEQWFLKTTAYADELLDGLDAIESGWPANVIKRQRDWIGRSEGAFVDFRVWSTGFSRPAHEEEPPKGGTTSGIHIRIFTTRIDTIYGANAIVVAAEHTIIQSNRDGLSADVIAKIDEIIAENLKPKDREAEIEKDGIDTGLKAVNPFSGEVIPVWVGNYVMMDYGTGAVMSVPGHDERDFDFAKKFGLPIKQVISAESEIQMLKTAYNEEVEGAYSSREEVLQKIIYGINNEYERREYRRAMRDILADSKETHDSGRSGSVGRESAPASDPKHVHGSSAARTSASNNAPEVAFTDHGILVNSGEWSGKTSEEAIPAMAEFAKANGFGETAKTFKIRDWGISRQRFWGSPIPIVYCNACGVVPEKYENLPVKLPENAPITGTGESPLTKVPEFYETTCPQCEGTAKRETDTMDTFVDSSWYYYRYTDPNNSELPVDPEIAAYWTPVDQYIGGDDHAVMHLIYARFWTKVMHDLGIVKFDEPFKRLLTQGMVVGETFFDDETGKRVYFPSDKVTVERSAKGKITSAKSSNGKTLKYAIERMSKSKGNGVDPDEMVEIYGADATRLFVLFAAPVENELVWHESGIDGAVRFLQRVWRFVYKWHDDFQAFSGGPSGGEPSASAKALRQKTHQTIKRIQDSLETLQFNTPVAAMMELCNAMYDSGIEPETAKPDEAYAVYEASMALTLMLTPFSPHFAEELFAQTVGNDKGILANDGCFPEHDESLAQADEIEVAVQVNGKLRSRVFAKPEASNEQLEAAALADPKVIELTTGKQIVKVVVVPKRLVNIVVRG